jgi:capsular polysaccharide biosynthesis protein
MKTDAPFNLDPESLPNADDPGTGLKYPPACLDTGGPQNESATASLRDGETPRSSVDPWSLAEAVVRRWHWLALGAILCGVLAFLGAVALWKTSYTAKVQLIRHDSAVVAEIFRDRQTSMQTFADLLRAPELIQRVSAAATPPLPVDTLASALVITPERNKESLTIAVTASSPERASELANLHAQESVQFTKRLQAQEAATLNEQLRQQLTAIENQTRQITERMGQSVRATLASELAVRSLDRQSLSAQGVTRSETPEAPTSPAESLSILKRSILVEQIRAAQVELGNLLSHFTDASPLVKAQRIKLAVLEAEFEELPAATGGGVTNQSPAIATVPGEPEQPSTPSPPPSPAAPRTIDLDLGRSQMASLEAARLPLAARQGLFQNLVDDPPGQLQVLVPARPQDAIKNSRKIKVAALSVFAAVVGMVMAGLLALLAEATGRRVKTDDDLRRVTRLPVIASLGNLHKMNQPARDQWSFQAWTALQGRLGAVDHSGLVCGIISSSDGEGRSTLVQLLARAASQRGYRVLTIDTCSAGGTSGSLTNGHEEELDTVADSATVTANVLASPGDVAHKLVGASPKVIVHIALPDWSWNLQRRKQLEAALDHWRAIDNVAILVNLPPASRPQAVLLAEELSNLVWLADSGRADAAATRRQIETLRQGRCRLIGAVLNHAPPHLLKNLFPRWVAA